MHTHSFEQGLLKLHNTCNPTLSNSKAYKHQDPTIQVAQVFDSRLICECLLPHVHCWLLQTKSKRNNGAAEEGGMRWTLAEVKTVEDRLLALGPNRTADVRKQVSPTGSLMSGSR